MGGVRVGVSGVSSIEVRVPIPFSPSVVPGKVTSSGIADVVVASPNS